MLQSNQGLASNSEKYAGKHIQLPFVVVAM